MILTLSSFVSVEVGFNCIRGAMLEGAEPVVVTAANKLPEVPALEERINEFKMLVEPLPKLLGPNALPLLPGGPRVLKNPPLLGAGAENENVVVVVANVVTPATETIEELAVVAVAVACQKKRNNSTSLTMTQKCIFAST